MSSATTSAEVMERLKAKADARAIIIDDVARILWTNGEMLADTEGGAMPSWDEVRAGCAADDDEEYKSACYTWHLDHIRRARVLLDVGPADALTLAKYLIDSAAQKQQSLELDLWRKIERAKGFEPGSLTGAPGVTQRVAL